MAAGDITAVRIANAAAHNGWVAEIDIEARTPGGAYAFGLGVNNDPSTAKIVFTVTSLGHDTAGGATTIQRIVYGTMWQRKAWPNQATADEAEAGGVLTVRVTGSEFIYATDTATVAIAPNFYTQGSAAFSGSVTNNSTLAHPKAIGLWAWTAFETVQGDFLLEAMCVHRSVRNMKPLAAVKFIVSDGNPSHDYTATVTDMTVSTREGVGLAADNKVLVYAVTVPIIGFDQGAVLTCNFTAYPWVGDAAAVLTSDTGITPPDERLCPLKFHCDKAATYGGAFAVVDAANGHNSTAATWVKATQLGAGSAEEAYATSTANSYTTIGNAAAAIKAFNNANYSRNNPGGGTILLAASHDFPGTTNGATLGAQDALLTITRLSTVPRASAIINAVGTSGLNAQRVKFYDVSFAGSGSSGIRGTSATTDVAWWDQCAFNLTGSAPPLCNYKLAYATRNTVTALASSSSNSGFANFSSTKAPFALIRGNEGPTAAAAAGIYCTFYCVLGNYNIRTVFQATGNGPGHAISDNCIAAFNVHKGLSQEWMSTSGTATTITHGNAFIQNLIERSDNSSWALQVDQNIAASNNILMWHNTLAGARMGVGYNDVGSTPFLHVNYSLRGNLYEEYANKDDTFPTEDAGRWGAWPVGAHVGCSGNHRLANTGEWLGEFSGLWTKNLGTWGFIHNAANDAGGGGDDTANGDYHPTPSADGYDLIASGDAVLPFDLEGTTRNNAGGGSAGVYEMNPPEELSPPAASSGRRLLSMGGL